MNSAEYYGKKVMFIKLAIGKEKGVKISSLNDRPLVEVTFQNFGQLILNLEITVTALGHALGINPFVQESVENSKNITRDTMNGLARASNAEEAEKALLAAEIKDQYLEGNEVVARQGIKFYFTGRTTKAIEVELAKIGKTIKEANARELINAFMNAPAANNYIGLFPYTNEDDRLRKSFSELRANLKTNLASHPTTLFDFGTGFHHSNNVGITCKEGATLLVTFEPLSGAKLTIPGKPYTTDQLIRAMVVGELGSLQKGVNKEMGGENPVERHAMRIDLPVEFRAAPEMLVDFLNAPKPAVTDEFTETEKAFTKPAADLVDKTLSKTNLTGASADEIRASIEKEATGLYTTLNAATITESRKKIVVLLRDTSLDPVSNAAAQAGSAAVAKYLGDSLIEVRGKGRSLLDRGLEQIAQLKADGKEFAVVAMVGNDTMSQIQKNERKELGKILNITDNGGKYLPVIGLYDLAIRIAYEQNPDDILLCLNRIASNPDTGRPFTRNEIEQLLKNGLIRILPRTAPVNMTEEVEAAKAAEKVLQAL